MPHADGGLTDCANLSNRQPHPRGDNWAARAWPWQRGLVAGQDPDSSPTLSIAQRVLESLAAEATARLATAELITHPGERGRARESILGTYLREIVPAGYDIETGFIIDAVGGQSLQQDLIIVRHDYHPVFKVGGVSFFPVEAVAAVLEVKSSLNGQTIDDALRNSASVKQLDRTAAGKNYLVVGGAGGVPAGPVKPETHEHQVFSLIVAAKSSAQSDTLMAHLRTHLAGQPRRAWPNFIAVAAEFSIGYNSAIRSDQMNAEGLRYFSQALSPTNLDPLVDLALELWSFLRVSPVVDIQPFNYVPGSMTGISQPFTTES